MYNSAPEIQFPVGLVFACIISGAISLIIMYYIIKSAVKEATSNMKDEISKLTILTQAIAKQQGISLTSLAEYYNNYTKYEELLKKKRIIEDVPPGFYTDDTKKKVEEVNNEIEKMLPLL